MVCKLLASNNVQVGCNESGLLSKHPEPPVLSQIFPTHHLRAKSFPQPPHPYAGSSTIPLRFLRLYKGHLSPSFPTTLLGLINSRACLFFFSIHPPAVAVSAAVLAQVPSPCVTQPFALDPSVLFWGFVFTGKMSSCQMLLFRGGVQVTALDFRDPRAGCRATFRAFEKPLS